jgi:Ca-activated chloride channel homolog
MNNTLCLGLAMILISILYSIPSHAVGVLYVRPLNSSQTYQQMSIKSYDATATIESQVSTTYIDQTFHNGLNSVVESTFIFPLPEGAVITELIYWFNGKMYVANIRERQSAQRSYDSTIRRMIDPAILTYFGTNTFKLNIAPINPNSDVRFAITYTELLPYQFGKVRYNFLLKTTDLSPTPLDRVSLRITAKSSTGFKIITSPSHGNTTQNSIKQVTPQEYSIVYGDEHFSPDRDYVLEFEYLRDGVTMSAQTYVPTTQDSIGADGFFATSVIPSDDINKTILPRSVVFTADVSSSMEGKRIQQLRTALRTFVQRLNPSDRFNIVLFSTNVVRFTKNLQIASADNIESALNFINRNVNAAGLTNINEALSESFNHTFPDSTVKIIAFLTDGIQSWGELDSNKIIANVKEKSSSGVRVYTYGIGDEPSRYLLNNIATTTGGYATYISDADSINIVITQHFERLSKALLTSLSLDYGKLDYYDVFPKTLPDLTYGSQVMQLGRYKSTGVYPVTLRGTVTTTPFSLKQDVHFPLAIGGNKSISRLWASSKINYLLDEISRYGERKELVNAIIDLSIRFQILTKYTALYSDPTNDKPNSVNELSATMVSTDVSPNPATDIVRINIRFAENFTPKNLTVRVCNLLGQTVAEIANGWFTWGEHSFIWNITQSNTYIPSGLYMIRIESEGGVLSYPVSVIR